MMGHEEVSFTARRNSLAAEVFRVTQLGAMCELISTIFG